MLTAPLLPDMPRKPVCPRESLGTYKCYEGHRTNLAFSSLDVADDGGQFRFYENDQCSAD
jgi:hypothetical protein